MVSNSLQIYRAPWVVPVSAPVIADGAIVTDGQHILSVASWSAVRTDYPDIPVCFFDGVFLPSLVNSHIHLDLSVLGTIAPKNPEDPMCDWIRSLMQRRMGADFSRDDMQKSAEAVIQDQYQSGVGIMLNISNAEIQHENHPLEIISLLELLAPTKAGQQAVIESIRTEDGNKQLTAHAPYSTGPELLSFIKKHCKKQNSLFSLHLAENEDEYALLADGEGCFVGFLQNLGAMDGTFPIPIVKKKGMLAYLDDLQLLDEKTLCVHCVHLDEEEIARLAETGAHICLCPGSNKFLNVGSAAVESILAAGVTPAIGTDSIASNPKLDLWQEMSIIAREHPQVGAEDIIRMATVNGAEALGVQDTYGSLASGMGARFIGLKSSVYETAKSVDELLGLLVSSGRPEEIVWLGSPDREGMR